MKVCKVPYGLECSLRTWRMSACTLLQSRVGRLPEGSQDSTLSLDSTLFKTLLCTNMLCLWNTDGLQYLYATDCSCANTLRRWCVKTLRHSVKYPNDYPRANRHQWLCVGPVVRYADDYLLFSTLCHLMRHAATHVTACHGENSKIPPVEVNTLSPSSPNEQYMGEDRRK